MGLGGPVPEIFERLSQAIPPFNRPSPDLPRFGGRPADASGGEAETSDRLLKKLGSRSW